MTPLDEAPEQRWRRTVDRRNRPAKLKVDRLLRDFGYDALDDEAGDAIEARLAGVALAVAPSLRDASADEVVTIYANDATAPQQERPAPRLRAADPAPEAEPEPAVATDVAQMVTFLKQQVLDARAEAERLRTELDRRTAAREDSETEAQTIIADQAAALQEQDRQIAELGAALNHTRHALAETRDEIRRAVGELQALPEPPPIARPAASDADDEPPPEYSLSGDDLADEFTLTGLTPAGEGSLSGQESADGREEAEAGWVPAALRAEAPAARAGEDALAPATAPAAPSPDFDLDEPPLGAKEQERAAETELDIDIDEPPLGAKPAEPEPEPESLEFDIDEPPLGAKPADSPSEWLPDGLAAPVGTAAAAAAEPGPTAGPSEFDHRPPIAVDSGAPANGAGDPQAGDDLLTDFDDFLYDDDDLYDPNRGEAPLDEAPADPPGLGQPTTVLPPPPPAPHSPFEAEPAPPEVHARATSGKGRRGRGGRGGRGRWSGNCSVCGRMPVENRRRDLEAAGWDLDDEAPACPQCRGLG